MTKRSNNHSSQGFTLLEIALAMAILGVVAIYTLDMYQSVSSRKRLVDDKSKIEVISSAFKTYFSGHEGLPVAGTSFPNSIPVDALGLGQNYRFDSHGRPYLFFPAANASEFQVDGRSAAGVIISLGEDQLQDYSVDPDTSTIYTTAGDDLLYPIEVHTESVAIALAELETLGKRVEAYNREFAGVDQNPTYSFQPGENTGYYGDHEASGAPEIIDDPEDYDEHYLNWPQLYPYHPYYDTVEGTPAPAGPPPTDEDLAYDEPDHDWPSASASISHDWPIRPPDPPIHDRNPLSVEYTYPPSVFTGWSEPGQLGFWPFGTGVFGNYNPRPTEGSNDSYELIDEWGCLPNADPPDPRFDPNCVFVVLDASVNPVQDIVTRYGLGSRLLTDPWGNDYQWGTALLPTDPRYHLFFSAGPDRTNGTDDDIILY